MLKSLMEINVGMIKRSAEFGTVRCDICGDTIPFGVPGAELSVKKTPYATNPVFRYVCYDCMMKWIAEQRMDNLLSYDLTDDLKAIQQEKRDKYKTRWERPGLNTTFTLQVGCFCNRYHAHIFESRAMVPMSLRTHGGIFFVKHHKDETFNSRNLGVNSYAGSFMRDTEDIPDREYIYSLFMQDKRWDLKHKFSICPSNKSMLCLNCPFNSYDGTKTWIIHEEEVK